MLEEMERRMQGEKRENEVRWKRMIGKGKCWKRWNGECRREKRENEVRWKER